MTFFLHFGSVHDCTVLQKTVYGRSFVVGGIDRIMKKAFQGPTHMRLWCGKMFYLCRNLPLCFRFLISLCAPQKIRARNGQYAKILCCIKAGISYAGRYQSGIWIVQLVFSAAVGCCAEVFRPLLGVTCGIRATVSQAASKATWLWREDTQMHGASVGHDKRLREREGDSK